MKKSEILKEIKSRIQKNPNIQGYMCCHLDVIEKYKSVSEWDVLDLRELIRNKLKGYGTFLAYVYHYYSFDWVYSDDYNYIAFKTNELRIEWLNEMIAKFEQTGE